jgi:hypothetical protein
MGHGLCQFRRFTITIDRDEALSSFDAPGTGQTPLTEFDLAARSGSMPWQ